MGDVLIDEGSWLKLHRELDENKSDFAQVSKFMLQHQGKKFKVCPSQMVNFSCLSVKYFLGVFNIDSNFCSIILALICGGF